MTVLEKDYSVKELQQAAQWVLENIGEKKVIALHGEMGAGKTTLVSAICNLFRVLDVVSSPTFSIINEYHYKDEGGNQSLFHIDLYRLKDEQEAIHVGVEECFYSGNYCFVEWPERTPNLLPDNCIHIYLIATGDQNRKLKIEQK